MKASLFRDAGCGGLTLEIWRYCLALVLAVLQVGASVVGERHIDDGPRLALQGEAVSLTGNVHCTVIT